MEINYFPMHLLAILQVLELVDLEGNRLNNVSQAFSGLRHLRYLYLANNNISDLPAEVFGSFCQSLKALSVSGNIIRHFPREGLRTCTQLSHLNIGYNQISEIEVDDLVGWAKNLDTLILRNNRLKTLDRRLFRGSPKLRELSLSFNEFERIDSHAFDDIGKTLESLEISFGLKFPEFPEAAIKQLQKLIWLALDNNEIRQISETSLYNQGELQYLNLEYNKLSSLPHNTLHQNVHKQLLDVRLSYNLIAEVRKGTFSALARVQTIALTGNRIGRIEEGSFRHMPQLATLMLSHNRLETIESRSFAFLDNLQKLELQHNRLAEFSLEAFVNCTRYPMHPLTLNVSHNRIVHLNPPPIGAIFFRTPLIGYLDAGSNRLRRIPVPFLELLAPALRTLDLSRNRIVTVDRLGQLEMLQKLIISRNHVMDLGKTAFHSLTSLQVSKPYISYKSFSLGEMC